MCALSLLWPERSRAKTTWPGMSRRRYASFFCLGFRDGGVDLDFRSSVFTGVGEVLFTGRVTLTYKTIVIYSGYFG